MSILSIDLFSDWLRNGERGISSEAIVTHLTGVHVGSYYSHDYPHDPDDFRRCELLLRAVPEARECFAALADKGVVWSGLAAAWDELVALGESEVPGAFDGGRVGGSAPKMYAHMAQITRPTKAGAS